jgi:predicted amidophosphoribosyltransferase
VGGAFNCPSSLDGHNILLVDDVITTGSTLQACVDSLKEKGANSVDILVVAHPSLNEEK